jgi:hypothetical protein
MVRLPRNANRAEICGNLIDLPEMAPGSFQIHTQARGPHWIAWVSRDGSGKPENSVVLVAATREEAEARAQRWGEREQ